MSAGKQRRGHRADDANEIDPSEFFEGHATLDRKARQLCKEVERTLSYALPACDDAWLRELVIVAVEPAPDASRVCVTLAAPPARDPIELRERLVRARGRLRAEIAAALQRKRTPELAFELMPAVQT